MEKHIKHGSDERGVKFQMIKTYRKRLLMGEDGVFVRTTNGQEDIFHFNEGFL